MRRYRYLCTFAAILIFSRVTSLHLCACEAVFVFAHAQLFISLRMSFFLYLCVYASFLIFAHAQVSTFAINYRGHPFMESLTENRALLYSLAGAGGTVVMLALGKSFDSGFESL